MKTNIAIVTGASQGIGRATAIRLARDFEAFVLTARQEHELKNAAASVQSAAAEPLTYALDLREPRFAEILVEGTVARSGRIDVLVNIAGAVSQIDRFELTDAKSWDSLKASNGAVAFISGSAALDPKPGLPARRDDRPLWQIRGDCRSYVLLGFQGGGMAHGRLRSYGWRRNQGNLVCTAVF